MKSMATQKPRLESNLFESPSLYSVSSRSVSIRAPTSLVEMKSTIHEVTRTARRRLVFCDASCDFVDRPLPSNKKNFKMTHYPFWIEMEKALAVKQRQALRKGTARHCGFPQD